MDIEDELYFQIQLNQFEQQYLKEIAEDCLKLFKEAIDESVYDSYSPTWYPRTMQLLNQCTYHIDNKLNTLTIYVDTDNITYNSWINYKDTGIEVGSAVPYFVESGHMDGILIENEYHEYQPRYYLEKAKSKILSRYGFDVEIINDIPKIV